MEGNLPTSRKSGIVVKKPVQWIFIQIVQYFDKLIQSGKNQPVHIIGPVRIIGT